MYFVGSAKTAGQFDSDSEDEHFAADGVHLSKSTYNFGNLGALCTFPFVWLCNGVRNLSKKVANLFKKTTETRQVTTEGQIFRKSRRISGRNNLQAESDVSEDEAEGAKAVSAGIFHRVSTYFYGKGSDGQSVDASRSKSYVEIPSDSFVDDEMEHETAGNGNFVPIRARQKEATQRDRLLCCLLPFLLLLLPLVLLFAGCHLRPQRFGQSATCQNLQYYSSHISDVGFAGFDGFRLVLAESTSAVFTTVAGTSGAVVNEVVSGSSKMIEIGAEKFSAVGNILFGFIRNSASAVADTAGHVGDVFQRTESDQHFEPTETEVPASGNYFSGTFYSVTLKGYQLCLDAGCSLLHLFTWIWFLYYIYNFFSSSWTEQASEQAFVLGKFVLP
jgi:hypothetical protein